MRKTRLDDIFQKWEADNSTRVKESTLAAYSFTFRKHILPNFPKLKDLTPKNVNAYANMLAMDGSSHATIRSIIVVIKMVMKYCESHGWISKRSDEIKTCTIRRKKSPEIFSLAEQRELLSYLQSHDSLMNVGIMICICSGLRIGEVCGLRWEDVDFDNHLIRVNRTVSRIYRSELTGRKSRIVTGPPKSSDSLREVPLVELVENGLARYHKAGREDMYVLSGSERPADPQNFRNNFNRVLYTLGIPRVKVHSLRHTFATRCLESDCDIKTLSTIMGHSNVTTTLNLYVHPGIERKRHCVEEMMKML